MPTTILGYKDIFGTSSKEKLLDLINGIDPQAFIIIISKISSLIFNGKKTKEILRELTGNETLNKFSKEYLAIARKLTSATSNQIFNEKANSELLKIVLLNYDSLNQNKVDPDFTILESSFLRAYLIINELTYYSTDKDPFKDIPKEIFQEFSQIVLIKNSIEYQSKKDFYYEFVKIKSLLHYYYNNEKEILNKFYQKYSIANPDLWILEILNVLTQKDDYENYKFYLENNHWLYSYLKNSAINHLFNKNVLDTQLRLHSILQYDDQFVIVNWSFFLQHLFYKIYYDLFILHRRKYPAIKNYNEYKAIVSKKVSEEIIFRTAIQKSFKRKSTFIKFDDDKKKSGLPDCYLRYGNNVIIFEFKDNAIGNEFITSDDYNFIKKYIDDRFITDTRKKNKAVGINQLAKFIKYLDNNHDFDEILFKNHKSHSINIYPVLVVSDEMFSYPAIEQYLTREFKKCKPTETSFTKIKELIVINLSSLIKYYLNSDKLDYLEIVKEYSSKKKKFKINGSFPKFPSIENIEYTKQSKVIPFVNLIKEIEICDISIDEQLEREKTANKLRSQL